MSTKKPDNNLDFWILHPIWGLPLFFGVMYLLFLFTIGVGGIFQDAFDILGRALFVAWPDQVTQALNCPLWFRVLILGLGNGVCTVLTFIPVLMSLFVGLGVLAQSGYLQRAARVADRLTRFFGLPGQALIPLLIGLGCNVPAILETRLLTQTRDRVLTIMMLPFVSCGARLAVYAVFVSAFFKGAGYTVIFLLYLTGVLAALLTAVLFRWAWSTPRSAENGVKKTGPEPLSPYQVWRLRPIIRQAWVRVCRFIRKVGLLILPCCVVLSCLSAWQPSVQLGLASFSQRLSPVLEPMGIQPSNWPATVGLLSGLLAKEAMIASLSALYAPEIPGPSVAVAASTGLGWMQSLRQAGDSVCTNANLWLQRSLRPWHLDIQESRMDPLAQQAMRVHFGSNAAAFAYLLFVLLYFPCISVVAVIRKELNGYWAALSVIWSSGLAYTLAVLCYQGHRWAVSAPGAGAEALVWMGRALGLLFLLVLLVRLAVARLSGFTQPITPVRGKSLPVRVLG